MLDDVTTLQVPLTTHETAGPVEKESEYPNSELTHPGVLVPETHWLRRHRSVIGRRANP